MHLSSTIQLALGAVYLAATTSAASVCAIPAPACSSPGPRTTYLPEPCFPKTGVCYPTNYYTSQSQSQMALSDGAFDTQIRNKCQAACEAQSQCAAFVGTENITPDGNLATGTCFLYSTQQVSPRSCADSPSRIIAYYKQQVCPVVTTTKKPTPSTTPSTTSSTTTSNAPAPTCTNEGLLAGPSSTCTYYQECEQALVGTASGPATVQFDESNCLSLCDAVNGYQNVNCYGYSYSYNTGTCQLFSHIDTFKSTAGVRSGVLSGCSAPKVACTGLLCA